MKKILSSVVAALLITAGSVAITTTSANATYSEELCVPSEAWTETIVVSELVPGKAAVPAVPEVVEVSHFEYQRYSWTGGGPKNTPPTEVPPSKNWQPNTTNYEGAGHGSDPIGVAFPKNHSGKGDWFFWTKTKVVTTPYVAGIPEIPAVAEIPAVTKTVDHPAVICAPEVEPPVKPVGQSEERTLVEVNCDTKSAEDTNQERRTVEPTFDTATNSWSDPVWTVWGTVSVTERDATAKECPVIPVVTPTPTETPVATPAPNLVETPKTVVSASVPKGELAETGSADLSPFAWFAGVVSALGAIFLIASGLYRRSHPVK